MRTLDAYFVKYVDSSAAESYEIILFFGNTFKKED